MPERPAPWGCEDVNEACLHQRIDELTRPDPLVREAASSAVVALGEAAIDPLVEALCAPSSSPLLCEVAAWILAHFGEAGIRPLIEALDHPLFAARLSATYTLERIGADALPSLLEATRRSERSIRLQAVMALGKLASSEAIPALLERLEDPDPEIRETAAFSLGQLGIQALPPVIKAAEHPSPLVRLGAVRALGKIGNFQAMPVLGRILTEEGDPAIKQAARKALDGIMLQPGTIDTDE